MNYWKKPCKCSKIAYQLMVNYADIIMFDDNFRKGWGGGGPSPCFAIYLVSDVIVV